MLRLSTAVGFTGTV